MIEPDSVEPEAHPFPKRTLRLRRREPSVQHVRFESQPHNSALPPLVPAPKTPQTVHPEETDHEEDVPSWLDKLRASRRQWWQENASPPLAGLLKHLRNARDELQTQTPASAFTQQERVAAQLGIAAWLVAYEGYESDRSESKGELQVRRFINSNPVFQSLVDHLTLEREDIELFVAENYPQAFSLLKAVQSPANVRSRALAKWANEMLTCCTPPTLTIVTPARNGLTSST